MRIEDGFQQTPHEAGPPYQDDMALQDILKRLLPEDIHQEIHTDLLAFSEQVSGRIRHLATLADTAQPRLIQYNHLGQRVDRLETSEGWRRLKDVSAEEGLVAIFYERKFGQYSRIYGFVKTYLWAPDSRLVGCPLAMTDGGASVLERTAPPKLRDEWLPRLTSRDPSQFVTAGQFMTERPGGTDVSQSETVAKPAPDNHDPTEPGSAYVLDGFKWFSSATDGAIALALARTSTTAPPNKQLSLFLVPLRFDNGVRLHRLKRKIGTWALPTAELELNNATGYLIGRLGEGVRTIAPVLNITRTHSAIASVSALSRALQIARAFAQVRIVRDRPLSENDLHARWLAGVEVRRRACLHLVVNVAALLGKSETGRATESEARRLRLLTPVTKYFCARIGVAGVTDCVEALGGQGYMEEEGLGRLLRDGLVERVWEGTGAAIALDTVRVLWSERGRALDDFIEWVKGAQSVMNDVDTSILSHSLALLPKLSPRAEPNVSRQVVDLVGFAAASVFLAEQMAWSQNDVDREILIRWLRDGEWRACVASVQDVLEGREDQSKDKALVFGKL